MPFPVASWMLSIIVKQRTAAHTAREGCFSVTVQNTAPMAVGYKITLSAFRVFPYNGACLTLCGPGRQ